jgi:hypothetical protein
MKTCSLPKNYHGRENQEKTYRKQADDDRSAFGRFHAFHPSGR